MHFYSEFNREREAPVGLETSALMKSSSATCADKNAHAMKGLITGKAEMLIRKSDIGSTRNWNTLKKHTEK